MARYSSMEPAQKGNSLSPLKQRDNVSPFNRVVITKKYLEAKQENLNLPKISTKLGKPTIMFQGNLSTFNSKRSTMASFKGDHTPIQSAQSSYANLRDAINHQGYSRAGSQLKNKNTTQSRWKGKALYFEVAHSMNKQN